MAEIVGVTEDCITLWENNKADPTANYAAKIIQFIDGLPPILPDTFAGKVKGYRYVHGLTHAQMARLVDVDASTIGAWEAGYLPNAENIALIRKLIGAN